MLSIFSVVVRGKVSPNTLESKMSVTTLLFLGEKNMADKSMIGGIYTVMEWISRFVYLQFLWAMFTVVGLIGFGFFPATLTMFAVTRKWIRGQTDIPLFPVFKQLYKKDFLKFTYRGVFAHSPD